MVKENDKIKLTEIGEDLCKQLNRKHVFTEILLADILEFDRQSIEKIACYLQHNISVNLAS